MAGFMQSGERSVRSVFVGNIPYDATEEQLKDIFSAVGPVVSFRLVYDRETGKPKGYGFCEYRDQETANSAMRNLNNTDLNGRSLRVDNAANEKTKEEIRNLQTSLGGVFESPYGPEVDPENAPEAIGKAVASLPPEQMFELAKQMKGCVVNNPNEARNILIQNPQLCYGLLHALVIMRVIDPSVASKLLHRPQPIVNPLMPIEQPQSQQPPQQPSGPQMPASMQPAASVMAQGWPAGMTDQFGRMTQPPPGPMPSVNQPGYVSQPPPNAPLPSTGNFDPRSFSRMREPAPTNLDPRLRAQSNSGVSNFDPRLAAHNQQQQAATGRSTVGASRLPTGSQSQPEVTSQQAPPQQSQAPLSSYAQNPENVDLIRQLLQLPDADIKRLPPEQQQIILTVKQQLASQ